MLNKRLNHRSSWMKRILKTKEGRKRKRRNQNLRKRKRRRLIIKRKISKLVN